MSVQVLFSYKREINDYSRKGRNTLVRLSIVALHESVIIHTCDRIKINASGCQDLLNRVRGWQVAVNGEWWIQSLTWSVHSIVIGRQNY